MKATTRHGLEDGSGGEQIVGGSRRVAYIDIIRGLAAAAVIVTHVHEYWLGSRLPHQPLPTAIILHLMSLGHAGVDVFVVLSGFCLAMPLVRPGRERGLRAVGFYQRRMWRILPAFYVSLIILLVLEAVPSLQRDLVAKPIGIRDVITHITLTQTLFPARAGSVNGSYWSIALEMQLYLVFPLVVWLALRRGWVAPLGIAAIVAAGWAALAQAGALSGLADPNHLLPARLVQFCAGALTAVFLLRQQKTSLVLPLVAVVGCGATAGLLADLNKLTLGQNLAWAGFGASLLITGSRLPEPATGTVGQVWRASRGFGEKSFSFYLLHQPVLLLLAPITHGHGLGFDLLLMIVLAFPLTYLLAIVLYRLAEVPGLNRGRRLDIYKPLAARSATT